MIKMFTITTRPSIEETMSQFAQMMRAHGYRPPVKEDLIEGAQLLMVEVERYMRDQSIDPKFTGTVITLDPDPIRPSNIDPMKKIVYYHCTMPEWDKQCFVDLEEFMTASYRRGCYENDWRWVIKVR